MSDASASTSHGSTGGAGGASPPEAFTDVGRGITLCHQSFGDESATPLLLNMGLGMQMVAWHDEFCQLLADRGYHVIRYDNRDAGKSTYVKGVKPPGLPQLATRRLGPDQYTLADMGDDAAQLIRELGVGPAHIVGASLGGMVAQTIASHHPDVTRTLTSIMSMTGSRFSGQPKLAIYRYLLQAPAKDRESAIESVARTFAAIGSPGFPADMDAVRAQAARAFDRGHNPAGTGRQLGAILKSGNRTRQLRTITAPTLVIHGAADPLVRPSGGLATAKAVPNAELMLIEGMGHDLPPAVWPRVVDGIVARAEHHDGAATPALA